MPVLSNKHLKPHDVSSRCTYYKRSLHWHGHVGSAMYLIGSESLTLAALNKKWPSRTQARSLWSFCSKTVFHQKTISRVHAPLASPTLPLQPHGSTCIRDKTRTKDEVSKAAADAPIQEGSRALGTWNSIPRTNRHLTWRHPRSAERIDTTQQ